MEYILLLAVQTVGQITKKWSKKKMGEFGIHFTIFLACVIAVAVKGLAEHSLVVNTALKEAVALLVAAIGTYEIFWKRVADLKSKIK